jgi:hypothetical protein
MDQNELGIVGSNKEYPSAADLSAFLSEYRADAAATIPTIEKVNNRFRGKVGEGATLDIQYSMALAYPTPVIYYIGTSNGMKLNPGTPLPDPRKDQYLQWLNQMFALPSVPQTISLGYATPESSISLEYAKALCPLFARLGLLGASVLVASGDDGVGTGHCNDPEENSRFSTTFPASCMCDIYSLLASCTQAQVQVTHPTVVISQVPGSLVSAVRSSLAAHPASRTGRRLQIAFLGAAFLHSFRARPTRIPRWRSSSTYSAACIKASTGAFALVA